MEEITVPHYHVGASLKDAGFIRYKKPEWCAMYGDVFISRRKGAFPS
jgi:hypothetical protein